MSSDSEQNKESSSEDEFVADPKLEKETFDLIEGQITFDKNVSKLKPFKVGTGFYLLDKSKKKFKLWIPPQTKQVKPDILKSRRKDLQLIEEDKKEIKRRIASTLISDTDLEYLLAFRKSSISC
uniref:Uncharacterized protein n=1 Tax=Rhabditophanes sp. KR3021 TaxID=114890 RepID=A0AC35TP04_9BILA